MSFLKRKIINIVGLGTGWENAPYLGEIWGATKLILRRPCNRLIDMNDYTNNRWGKSETEDAEAAKKLANEKRIPYIDLTNYPLKEVIACCESDYFTNTIDYMIALAIYEHVKEIHLYGVNMSLGGEYEFEKPGVDYWCGYAKGRGLTVKVHGKRSRIMECPDKVLYGYYTPQESLEWR